jgi:hypothetical protein
MMLRLALWSDRALLCRLSGEAINELTAGIAEMTNDVRDHFHGWGRIVVAQSEPLDGMRSHRRDQHCSNERKSGEFKDQITIAAYKCSMLNNKFAVKTFNLAKDAGTSVDQIERFYARHLPLSAELARNLQSFGESA